MPSPKLARTGSQLVQAYPTPELMAEQMRWTEWAIESTRHELRTERHARRCATLKRNVADWQTELSRMTTELGAMLQETR